jgi:hypothetical protein
MPLTGLSFDEAMPAPVFPGAACVSAVVDCFAQHFHKVDNDADSWRDRHSFERDDPPQKLPPSRPPRKR